MKRLPLLDGRADLNRRQRVLAREVEQVARVVPQSEDLCHEVWSESPAAPVLAVR
jgi:hypothetical protein